MAQKANPVSGAEVVVAHPGTQHSYETAFALQEAGLLREYITGLYFKRGSGIGRFLSVLPMRMRQSAIRQLGKRHRAGLDEDLIHTYTWLEAVYLGFARAPIPWRVPDHVLLLRNRLFGRFLAKRVRALNPDAVLCYDTCALEAFRAASEVGALKILDQTACHLAYTAPILAGKQERDGDSGSTEGKPPDWLVDECIEEARQADLILAGSEFVLRSLECAGVEGGKVAVLPYGANIALFEPSRDKRSGPLTVVYAGQIRAMKGIGYLLEAFRGLQHLGCRLLLIGQVQGDGRWLEKYDGSFEHVPFVPRTELAGLLKKTDIFVYPSLLEGSALAIYEALASGLPVVTTPNSGSIVRDGIEGFVVPPRDVDALRERIKRLAVDEDLRDAMGLAARRRAEEYSWSNYHKRLAALVRENLGLDSSQSGEVLESAHGALG